MGALVKACDVDVTPKNTGVKKGCNLAAPAMFILVPKEATWDDDDLADFLAFIETKMHATASQRWYPIPGDIKNIENNEEADTMETFPDGSQVFVRYGNYNRMVHVNTGGTCLAKALMSFNGLRYSFIEVDINGKVGFKKVSEGVYAGFKADELYAPKPKLADFGTSYMNKLFISVKPKEYIEKAEIFQSEDALSDLIGLQDAKVSQAAAPTATKLRVAVETVCDDTDLVALLGSALAVAGNFVVTNKNTSAVITPSAAAIVNGYIELTVASQTTGHVINVKLAAPSVLKAAGIAGYEGNSEGVDLTIP